MSGEERIIKVLYLALTSRVLPRIVSVVLKGPSSAGKSFLTDQTLAYFPASAYMLLTGMSEKSLAYGDEPLSHRMLVVAEAAGAEASYPAYLLRTLLSEGRIVYHTVEKTAEGLRGRLIQREGPTGLVITTTAVKLHGENETRLLSLTVNDSSAQTREILLGRARNQQVPPVPDEWLSLQEWLAATGTKVLVPFAEDLARQIPPVATRLRRDFNAVLGMIEAHAVLHQAHRPRDASGAVLATEADYTAVRDLLAQVLAEGVGASVPAQVRETVAAVQKLTTNTAGVTIAALAQELGIDPSTTSRRVAQAVELGHVSKIREGRSAKLLPGMPLPGDRAILPKPSALFTRPPSASQATAAAAPVDTMTAWEQHLAALSLQARGTP